MLVLAMYSKGRFGWERTETQLELAEGVKEVIGSRNSSISS